MSLNTQKNIVIIGGGPAGLRAAEVASSHGAQVTLYESMRSVGRKFLIAGKSGLNLTNNEDLPPFLHKYSGNALPHDLWRTIITNFDNNALRKWAASLGIKTFAASSGKVFPSPVDGSIKAAPLLRAWIRRLRENRVIFKTSHRWTGIRQDGTLLFDHMGNQISIHADATILALGGASWPQTGSDGHWIKTLSKHGIKITPLSPANCGWEVDWPPELLAEAEGLPLKNLLLTARTSSRKGELVITRHGLEGGPIYRLGPAIRSQTSPYVIIDFKPDFSHDDLVARMGKVTRNFIREARRRLKLDPATCAILKHMPDRGPWKTVDQLVREIKHCRIPLTRPRPIEEAISSAGGVSWSELDEHLMLKKLPGVYVAGEMIDWEAPTGGYLLQACFATGNHVGHAVVSS